MAGVNACDDRKRSLCTRKKSKDYTCLEYVIGYEITCIGTGTHGCRIGRAPSTLNGNIPDPPQWLSDKWERSFAREPGSIRRE